jgi:hypothetical protein
MTGISEKCVKVIVRTSRKSRKIGQHRITKTTQNQLCPNQRSQVTKMRYQEGAEDSPTATSAPHLNNGRFSTEKVTVGSSTGYDEETVQRDLASIAAVEQEEVEALRKWCEGSIAEMVSGKNAAQCQSRSRD